MTKHQAAEYVTYSWPYYLIESTTEREITLLTASVFSIFPSRTACGVGGCRVESDVNVSLGLGCALGPLLQSPGTGNGRVSWMDLLRLKPTAPSPSLLKNHSPSPPHVGFYWLPPHVQVQTDTFNLQYLLLPSNPNPQLASKQD